MGFSFSRLCHASRVGLGGDWGQKFNFSEHGHVAYYIESHFESQSADLRVESKGQISSNSIESVGICDSAPWTVHSFFSIKVSNSFDPNQAQRFVRSGLKL